MLLAAAERRLGLLAGLGRRLVDRRQGAKVEHRLAALLRQRVFAVALGHEDVNDHESLRDDLVLQTACGRDRRLASPSTVGRLERAADRSWAWAAHVTMVEAFIASFDTAPDELVLDFDATDDAVHGRQVGRFFHGYYDHYCFPAALCLLRRAAVGELPQTLEHRRRQARLGNSEVAGDVAAPGLAGGADHPARR